MLSAAVDYQRNIWKLIQNGVDQLRKCFAQIMKPIPLFKKFTNQKFILII